MSELSATEVKESVGVYLVTLWSILGGLLIYIISPIPVLITLESFSPGMAEAARDGIYAPIVYCYDNFPVVEKFYDWQVELVEVLL